MSVSCNDDHNDCTGLRYSACTDQCSYSSCSPKISAVHQTCFQRHPSQSFPATQCHRGLGLVHACIPEQNLPFGLPGHSRCGSVAQQSYCHQTINFLQLENPVCQYEGLERATWPLLHSEDFPRDVSFPRATESWNITSPELDQFSYPVSVDERPLQTTQPTAASVYLDTCSWTMSPADLYSLEDNSQSGLATLFSGLSRSFDEATPPQLGPIEPRTFFDGSNDEHAINRSVLCSEELEVSNLAETFGTMDAESSISLCLATRSLITNTQTIVDNDVCTAESPDTILRLNNDLTADPKLTSFADSTRLFTTSAMPGQYTPANMIANIAVEAVGVSRVREDPHVQALNCPFPGCTSKKLFTRTCDLNKHYRQHFKRFFCRIEGCHMSEQAVIGARNHSLVGFALKKDRARHETSHDPSIRCEVCGKVFSRADNMQSHMQRIHRRYFSS